MLRLSFGVGKHWLYTSMAIALTIVIGACSPMSPERPSVPGDLELTTLRIAVTKVIDTVPLRLATQRGLFREAGLRVELVEMPSQRLALTALRNGDVEVAFGGNIALLRAAADGAALEIQCEAYISGTNTMALVALPGIGPQDPGSNPAPIVAVDPDDDLGRLATTSRLAIEGIDPTDIEFLDLGFVAAKRYGGPVDHASLVASLLGISIPVFFLAILLKYVFAVKLGWLPTVVLTTLMFLLLLWQFSFAIVLFLLSLAVAAALRPLINSITGRYVPKRIALGIIYFLLVAAIVSSFWMVGPPVLDEMQRATDDFVSNYDRAKAEWPQQGTAFQPWPIGQCRGTGRFPDHRCRHPPFPSPR